MGDRQRSALLYLLAEDRDNAAVAAQHVAKTDGHEMGLAHPGQVLHIELRGPFRGAHHVGGIDRLVGGDHDEMLDAELVGGIGNDPWCRVHCC